LRNDPERESAAFTRWVPTTAWEARRAIGSRTKVSFLPTRYSGCRHLTIRTEDDPRSLKFGKKVYLTMPGSKLVFTEAAIGKAHIFRMAHSEADVICDQDMKDACRAAGLRRTRFCDVSKL
jgi:hypothetical protein